MTSDFNTRVCLKSPTIGWFIMKGLCLTVSNISVIFYVMIFKGGDLVT